MMTTDDVLQRLKDKGFAVTAKALATSERELTTIRRLLKKLVKSGAVIAKKHKAYHNTYNPSFGGTVYAQHYEFRYSLP
jgi:hypothetical protein